MKNEYQINDDLTAFHKDNLLIIRSENYDDFDIYCKDTNGDWDIVFDSLSNRVAANGDDLEQITWMNNDFCAWSEKLH